MQHSEFHSVDPSEVIYAVIMQEDILSVIERRLGEDANTLTEDDLRLACEEVKIAFDHNSDERDNIDGSR